MGVSTETLFLLSAIPFVSLNKNKFSADVTFDFSFAYITRDGSKNI